MNTFPAIVVLGLKAEIWVGYTSDLAQGDIKEKDTRNLKTPIFSNT